MKHLIYSGVENVKREMGFEVPHFDGKGEVEDYLKVIIVIIIIMIISEFLMAK